MLFMGATGWLCIIEHLWLAGSNAAPIPAGIGWGNEFATELQTNHAAQRATCHLISASVAT
jgi:hypothetical protein